MASGLSAHLRTSSSRRQRYSGAERPGASAESASNSAEAALRVSLDPWRAWWRDRAWLASAPWGWARTYSSNAFSALSGSGSRVATRNSRCAASSFDSRTFRSRVSAVSMATTSVDTATARKAMAAAIQAGAEEGLLRGGRGVREVVGDGPSAASNRSATPPTSMRSPLLRRARETA